MAVKGKKSGRANVVTAPGTLVVTLDSDEMKKMTEKCIRETGKVTFSIREVTVTKLGEMTEAMVIVN